MATTREYKDYILEAVGFKVQQELTDDYRILIATK